jgi:hypothetical protein
VKRTVAAIVVAVASFFAANMLSVAVAEAPTVTPLRTISVEGVATLPIGQFDDGPAATAVYREGTAAAVTDAQGKATFLASKVGGTVATVQSVVEGGGYINCIGGDESSYVEYDGVEPDFGTGPTPSFASTPESASTSAPAKGESSGHPVRRLKPKRAKKRKTPVAKKATAVSCTLTAQVSLVYALG